MTKKNTQTANINATLYDGEFQVGYDCVGVEICRFALCEIMPPTGDNECAFRAYGSCKNPPAQQTALEALRNKITRELKKFEDNE
jgi:hypothetical protein